MFHLRTYLLVRGSDAHLDMGEVFVINSHIIIICHQRALGHDEVSDTVLIEHLDSFVCPAHILLSWLEAVGHSAEADYIPLLKLAGDDAMHLH